MFLYVAAAGTAILFMRMLIKTDSWMRRPEKQVRAETVY
jgi:hypothetical protein